MNRIYEFENNGNHLNRIEKMKKKNKQMAFIVMSHRKKGLHCEFFNYSNFIMSEFFYVKKSKILPFNQKCKKKSICVQFFNKFLFRMPVHTHKMHETASPMCQK